MNAEHEDEKFVGLRVSGHTWQNNDPPPEFTGTKPSEFKNYREKVRRWLLFTRTLAQLQGPHVLSRLTGPAWYACDELEPEDVATADGVNMILDTFADACQDDYDVDGPHTAHVSQVKEALFEQEDDIKLEIALAALEQEGDTELEETDVQEMPLACKGSRQLRGEQRVNFDQEHGVCSEDVSCQPSVALQDSGHGKFCTGVACEVQNCGSSRACEGEPKIDCQWREWNSWPSCSVTSGEGQYSRSGFERGHWTRACPILIGQNTLDKWEQMLTRRWDLSTQRIGTRSKHVVGHGA